MPWYDGPSLLELLESLPPSHQSRTRARSAFRCSACFAPITPFADSPARSPREPFVPATPSPCFLPAARAKVERIVTWDGDLAEAIAPLSVTLVLDRELDISRGDLIVSAQAPATVAKTVTAALVWMDQRPLELNRRYLLKHTSQTVPAFIPAIRASHQHRHARARTRRDARDERHRRRHVESVAPHRPRPSTPRIAPPAHSFSSIPKPTAPSPPA